MRVCLPAATSNVAVGPEQDVCSVSCPINQCQHAIEDKSRPAVKDAGEGQPSNVLFVENLPAEVNDMMLKMLFRQYPGFQEARLIAGRNVAFIEYADELQAGIAKHGLQGFKVTPEMALKIAFAKQ